MLLIIALRRRKQAGLYEFKASQEWDPVFNKQNNNVFKKEVITTYVCFYCLRQGPTYIRGWSETQRSSYLCLLSAGIKSKCYQHSDKKYNGLHREFQVIQGYTMRKNLTMQH